MEKQIENQEKIKEQSKTFRWLSIPVYRNASKPPDNNLENYFIRIIFVTELKFPACILQKYIPLGKLNALKLTW